MIDLEKFKPGIAKLAERKSLSLIVLYGSQATGKAGKDSDIDIAILGERPLGFRDVTDLINDFSDIFGSNEIDIKPLHFCDPLFRFQVMRDGILLFGDKKIFYSFRAFAFRDYFDSWDLFRLKEQMVQKRLAT